MTQKQELQITFEISAENIEEYPEKTDFDHILLTAVDSAFAMLGDSSREAVYRYLENNCRINRREIPCKLDAFVLAIEDLFGKASDLIEMKIMQSLHQLAPEFKFSPREEEFSFLSYVETLRARL